MNAITAMTDDELLDLIVAVVIGIITAGVVELLGGPYWAAFGFGVVAFWLSRLRDALEAADK